MTRSTPENESDMCEIEGSSFVDWHTTTPQLEGLERERDFYFQKLRDIEILLQGVNDELKGKAKMLSDEIFRVLYDKDDDGDKPAEAATEKDDDAADAPAGVIMDDDDGDDAAEGEVEPPATGDGGDDGEEEFYWWMYKSINNQKHRYGNAPGRMKTRFMQTIYSVLKRNTSIAVVSFICMYLFKLDSIVV